jgi:hypothetical protein
MMRSKFGPQLLVGTLALFGIITYTTEAPAHSELKTTFSCLPYGNHWATFAKRGKRQTGPMIVWKSEAFGPDITPKDRCEQVSNRFTTAVENNGGTMRNLLLTSGSVNGETVICFVNTAEHCNSKNTLFSLKPENASHSGDVLARLLRFSQRGAGRPVFESGGGNEENSSLPGQAQYINLEDVVNKAFDEDSSADSTKVANPGNALDQASGGS